MRLSKKIAAVALAAVMAVSMLTACGGTDGPSSSRPSSSSPSSSSPSSSSSGSGSTTDPSSGSSSNSGTEDKEENVAYKNSRTAKFFQKLGTTYTLGSKLDITINGESGTADMLVVTNGSRAYQKATTQSNGNTVTQTMLVEMTKQKAWVLMPNANVKDQGKLGYCYSSKVNGTSTGAGVPGNGMPIEGLKFKQETKGNYYIETQNYKAPSEDGMVEVVIAYYFKGNSSVPEYVDVKESLGSKGTATIRVTYTRIEYKADAKYLDFETILKQYIDITDQINPSTVQAQEPSVASLIIG